MDNLAAGHWGFTAFFWASGPPLLVMRQLQAIDVLRGKLPRPEPKVLGDLYWATSGVEASLGRQARDHRWRMLARAVFERDERVLVLN